ncbi:hypothetical protein MTBBW1_620034 [Desulfamplus magnetovallimortis]|uniref:Uncharacterized protein n=1 Tax=Desulfamplus magnetovallimortis TaxID=1246637 RepID=A0A1W1HIG6_9BACT|nr:hypothetical protein MTBBW1_620034 [Desulfamplus magnetovallimortis]
MPFIMQRSMAGIAFLYMNKYTGVEWLAELINDVVKNRFLNRC